MADFLHWTLPMPVVAAPGGQVSLGKMLSGAFDTPPEGWDHFWLTYYGAPQLSAWDFSYWNPSAPKVASWSVDGADIGAGFDHQRFVSGASMDTALLTAGSDIGPLAYLTVPISGVSGSYAEYIQYSLITVDPHVLSAKAGQGEPTAADIVATAYRYASYYGDVPNDNDCHYIAASVAAATGATFTDFTQNLDPTQNQEAGFWRIAYRGSDAGARSDWQALLKAGDIVRMGWNGGGQHTVTVLKVNTDGTMVVYDNTKSDGHGGTVIGVHTVDFDNQTIASTITVYRLSSDGLYLENGTALDEALPGTRFNDHQFGFDGADTLSGGVGADVLVGGAGVDVLTGGKGADLLTGGGSRDSFVFTKTTDSAGAVRDQITDLDNKDRIDLRQIDADTTRAGNQAFHLAGDHFTHAAGELIATYDSVSKITLFQGDVNGDGVADLSFTARGDHHAYDGFQL